MFGIMEERDKTSSTEGKEGHSQQRGQHMQVLQGGQENGDAEQ